MHSPLAFAFSITAIAVLVSTSTSCASLRSLAGDLQRMRGNASPAPPERRVVKGLESACAAGSIVWIVPVEGGVVLVDAGFDETGQDVARALKGRRVLAVLLTHGHLDHRSAAHLFGAPVYVGRGDRDVVTGARAPEAIFAKLASVVGVPDEPKALLPVDDNEVIVIGKRTFTAIALPGHTSGSTAWKLDRWLFTGDAIQGPLGDGELYPAPWFVTDDMRLAYESMAKLAVLDVDTVLDGHFGRTDDVNAAARRAVSRVHHEDALYASPWPRPEGCGGP